LQAEFGVVRSQHFMQSVYTDRYFESVESRGGEGSTQNEPLNTLRRTSERTLKMKSAGMTAQLVSLSHFTAFITEKVLQLQV